MIAEHDVPRAAFERGFELRLGFDAVDLGGVALIEQLETEQLSVVL